MKAFCLALTLILTQALNVAAAASEPNGSSPSNGRFIALTDSKVFLSPYCWRIDATGSAISPASEGYLKCCVSGTHRITLHINTVGNRGLPARLMPTVKVIASGPTVEGMARYYQFPANDSADTSLTIATGLNPKLAYRVTIQMTGPDESSMNGWVDPTFQAQINRLEIDPEGTFLPVQLRPKRALFLGASYEQAYFGMIDVKAPVYTYVDQTLSWPFFVAYGLDCEYGQMAIGGQGWVRPGGGGYPPFPASWDHFDPTNVKGFRNDLDYVFVHMAENDAARSDKAVQDAVASWIPKARAAFGKKTKIFIILSLPQIKSAPIKEGVRDVGDPQTYILDPGTEFQHCVFAGGPTPTWASPGDGIHLDAVHQSLFTAFVIKQAQTYLDREGQPGR